jgi:hypothetical protein
VVLLVKELKQAAATAGEPPNTRLAETTAPNATRANALFFTATSFDWGKDRTRVLRKSSIYKSDC